MKNILILLFGFMAALPAAGHQRLGSIINSFNAGAGYDSVCGIARTGAYLTVPVERSLYTWFRRYTPAGSSLGSFELGSTGEFVGSDRCHLGDGYIAIRPWLPDIYYHRITGSAVSFITTNEVQNDVDFMWDGTYYQPLSGYPERYFYRYTPAGSFAGSWTPSAWPTSLSIPGGVAHLTAFNNVAGSYVVVTAENAAAGAVWTLPGGSLVATFTSELPGSYNSCGGPSSNPVLYGDVLWVCRGSCVYEVDMGNGVGSAIMPSSLGRVKAIYK